MEFEEVQSIWNAQDEPSRIQVDMKALQEQVRMRYRKAVRITRISEVMLIGVYLGVGTYTAVVSLGAVRYNMLMDVLAAWLLIVGLAALAGRMRRVMGARRFDRSVEGELQHALMVARYQVRLSGLMRWNMLVIALLMGLALWNGGRAVGWILGASGFFVVTYYFSGFEHRMYVRQLRRLEELRSMLAEGVHEAG